MTSSAAGGDRAKGLRGELVARRFLEAEGYTVVAANYRWRGGEVDLVVEKDGTLVFVEVKTWDSLGEQDLEYGVDRRKQWRIRTCAEHFLSRRPPDRRKRVRFDVILVSRGLKNVRHIEDAF